MDIDKELIKKVGKNARIALTDEEAKKFTSEIKEILDSFSKIKDINTYDIEPSFHPIELKERTREDIPEKCLTQEEALSNSQNNKDGYFKGPKAV